MATCPICFEDIKVKASPDSCDHIFCLTCLEKWSKLGSFCPVDRKRYKKIINLELDCLIQVKGRKRKKTREVYDFSAKCEICLDESKPEVLLLCDCCDLAYHTHCLSPPLKAIPAGLWFCPTCTSVEKKLRDKNGITKEVEVDLGHSNLLLQKGRRHGQRTKEKFEEVKKDPESTLDELKTDKFIKDKKLNSSSQGCSDVVIEFEGVSSRRYDTGEFLYNNASSLNGNFKSFQFEPQSHKNKNLKVFQAYDIENQNENLNAKKIETECINSENKRGNDFCLKELNKLDLIDDCLSQAVAVGYLKFDASDDDEVSTKKNKPSCSGVSDKSIKGTFNLISHLCVDPYIKETDFEIVSHENKNDLTKEKISFSVFDRIEGAGAPQNKYFDISAKSCVSVSSKLNINHCFSCKDVIIGASQKYCKICKLKYSISCAGTEKYKEEYTDCLKYSQAFESSCIIKKGIKSKKNNSQRNTCKNMKKLLERRHHSLIRKLRKIHDSQKKSETC